MREVYGDFWEHAPNYSAICVTTNGIVKRGGRLVMGGGMAKQFLDRYPRLDFALGHHVSKWGNVPGVVRANTPHIVSFPTKNDYRDASPLDLIEASAATLVALADVHSHSWANGILTTRPGCGLGGQSWQVVKPILEKAGFDDRFTIIAPESER